MVWKGKFLSGAGVLFLWVLLIALLLLISVKISVTFFSVDLFFISARTCLIFLNVCNALMLVL